MVGDSGSKKKEDFLYDRMGPWPQPCPEHPWGEAPAVLRLPFSEALDWWIHVGFRYMKTLAYAPVAYIKGMFKPGLEPLADQEFERLLQDSMMAKFIKPDFDDKDIRIFSGIMRPGEKYFIVDLEAVKVVKPFDGMSVSASKTLLIQTAHLEYKLVCIYLDKTETIFYPGGGNNWELAKYFVMQGGALAATLVVHPLLHFPLDSINAITKTALPKDHLLFKLLYPHLRFTLYLENAVLTFNSSLLESKWWMPYAPYPGNYDGLRDLLVQGFKGIKGNASYQSFKYPQAPEKVYGKYGECQDAFFAVVRTFVANVLSHVEEDDFYVAKWASYISHWVPGFPDSKDVAKRGALIDAVAYYFWDVTMGHSVDHYNYGKMNIRQVPLRMRSPVPGKEQLECNYKKLNTFWDYGKYKMAQILFFGPSNVTTLIDTEYDLPSDLQIHVQNFKKELRQTAERLKNEGKLYIPLEEIAASIQY
jgi:hypothetical protein